ncbi:MAG: rod shape-determining protein MreC [Gemmatimonadota bacterium]
MYGVEPETTLGRRQITLAVVVFLAALVITYLPSTAQQRLAWGLRVSVLRPFIATQERLAAARLRAMEVEVLQGRVDSLTSRLTTLGALEDENRTLRSLLGLSERLGPAFRPATVLRPGTPGSESMFLIFLGEKDGVRPGAPVVARNGLVGVIREVRGEASVGMDWTHPDFRASAMIADGSAYGIVENRRGAFREGDRLVLEGAAYHERIDSGAVVLTSGLGGVFPRGIPIGWVEGVAEAGAQWRKSYWVRPGVEVGSVTHVLVAVGDSTPGDLTRIWEEGSP